MASELPWSVPAQTAQAVLRSMRRIRAIEERIAARYAEGKMRCPVHLSTGQEGVSAAAGVALRKDDLAVSTHRAHGHYLGKGGDLPRMLAEIYGKRTGCSSGKGGSMHLIDQSVGFKGSSAIVGGTVPIGTGLALSIQLSGGSQVACVFLGDGTIEEGVFYESANFAAVRKLPLLFLCENNLYSVYSPLRVRQPEGRRIHEVARAIGITSQAGDGDDALQTYRMIADAVTDIRSGGGPRFLEFSCYRWREHCGPNFDNDIGYRTEEEYRHWRSHEPVGRLEKELLSRKLITPALLSQWDREVEAEIDAAFQFAEESPFPDPSEGPSDVFAEVPPVRLSARTPRFQTKTFAQAVNDGLAVALEADRRVICYGLGTDDPKGVFGTTLGLQQRFGAQRVFDMPTSENAMTGVAIGAAMNGAYPVMCHQRLDFFLLAMDQLVNHAAKWFYTFGGRQPVPITIRLILGRGWGQGPTHCQNLQSWFAHIPGLKVLMPATPADAKGMLLSAIFDPNPVVILEHRWLHEMRGEVPEGDVRVPIGKANVVVPGTDVTIVSLSYMTVEALHAISVLSAQGISAELIDLRTISPLDWSTVLASVHKTGRLLVLDTASETCSVAGEVIAKVATELFEHLRVAPRRICLPDYPSPTSPALTKNYYPGAEDIVQAVGQMLQRSIPVGVGLARQGTPHDVPGTWFRGPF